MAIEAGTISSLLQTMFKDYEESRAAKRTEYEGGKGILTSIVDMFGPGYLKGEEKKMLAEMEQGMVGRGLGGTTRPAAAGMGIKADIRDRQTQARTGAMTNVAQYMAGFQDIAPTPGTLAHLATGGFSGMLSQQQLAMEQERWAAEQPTKRYGEGSFGGSGLLYSTGGAAGRLGGGGGAGGTTGGGAGWTGGGTAGGGTTATGAGAAMYGVSGGISGGGYQDPTIGQQILGGPQAGGMYLGGGEALGPGQVGWPAGSTPMGERTGPTTGEPTIAEYLQQHGLDPTSTDPGIMGRARTLQQQWASMYR